MLQYKVLLCTVIIIILVVPDGTGTTIRVYNSTAQIFSNDEVPRGSTVVLVCTETPTPQQVDYQWTCTNSPCDGQYWKVYGNVLVVVATAATRGLYRCDTTPGSGKNTRTLAVQGSLLRDPLAIYNNGRLLLQNTLFTNLEQISNRLTCTRSGISNNPMFRSENGTTLGTRSSSQSTTVQAGSLQPNGGYRCDAGEIKRKFFIYFNSAILPAPQVSVANTTTDQQLHLLLTTPPPYNSGRFILRYDCTLREADIEVEYRSADPGVNSNTVVTRSRSCFVLGEISRVTVWFVNGENISTTPTEVDVNGANITVIPIRAIETTTPPTTNPATSSSTTTTTTARTVTTTATTLTATSTMPVIPTRVTETITSPTTNPATSTTTKTTNPATTKTTNPATTITTTTMSDNHVLYIGSGAGCLLLVLVAVLAVIICCVVAVHRRGKRSRSTEHTPTLHYYSTPGHEQEEEPQVQIGADNYDTVREKPASFTPGTLYDEVEIKSVKPKPVVVPSEYQLPLVETDKEDEKEAHNTVTTPESFYAQPDTTAKSNKKEEKGTTADVEDPDVLYAEVDKPKKKKKKGKEKKEQQPQGDLYAVVDKTSKKKAKEKKAKEKEQQGDEDLYAEVDKTQKKGKKTKEDNESNSFREAAAELDSPPPVPNRSLIYEPSADREASDQEQQQQQELEQQLQLEQQQQPEKKVLQGE